MVLFAGRERERERKGERKREKEIIYSVIKTGNGGYETPKEEGKFTKTRERERPTAS